MSQYNRKSGVSLMSMLAASLAIAPKFMSNQVVIRPGAERATPRLFVPNVNNGRWRSSRMERGVRNPTEAQQAKTAARGAKRQRDYDSCLAFNPCLWPAGANNWITRPSLIGFPEPTKDWGKVAKI